MSLRSLLLTFCFLTVISLFAHDFWLEPQQYIFSRGEEINIRFKVGEGFAGENWTGSKEKINNLQFYYADVDDQLNDGLNNAPGDSLQFSLFEEGTAMVTFNSNNSFIELDAQKFNDYLQNEGLTTVIDYRKEQNETDSAGREYYQRSVKTIVQVGNKKTEVYKKQTSLPLDIIPLSHPYTIGNNQLMKVKFLFNGEPLANKKIKTWHKLLNQVTDSTLMSDEKGEISFPVETSGEWMLSCVHTIHIPNDSKAQWQSYWGSVTWGYTGRVVQSDKSR
jgi:uncharacterized GH25 family protein